MDLTMIPENQNGIKLKDPAIRQEAYRQYLEHLAKGYPKETFFFDHPTHSVCYKTLDKYLRDHPDEFPPILMEKAKASRYRHWFDEGKMLMQGKYRHGSPVVWGTIMRNIFKDIGWDREISSNDDSEQSRVFESIMKQISEMQAAQASEEGKIKANENEV
jgi:hypothetical protein